jgi:ABC-type multidrug transport system fused ATPase/permease subunit
MSQDWVGTLATIRGGIALLTRGEIVAMAALFGAMSIVGLLEAAVVALVLPFVQTILQPELLNRAGPFSRVAAVLGFEWSAALFPWLAGTLVVVIVVSSTANLAVNWMMERQAGRCRNRLGHEVICRLVAAPFLWFLSKNTAILARQIFSDIHVWRNNFLHSIMEIARSIVLIIMPASVVVALAPSSGLLAILLVGLLGLVMILLVRSRLQSLVRNQKTNMDATMRMLQQLLTGIREVKVSNRAEFFASEFDKHHEQGNRYFASQRFLSQLSPSLIQTIGQVVFIGTAALLWAAGLSGGEVTAQLAVLGVVVMRVLPAVNNGATRFNILISSIPFVEALLVTMREVEAAQRKFGRSLHGDPVPIGWHSIRFEAVSFRFPGADRDTVDGLTVTLERGKRYGIVGRSGSGKTTMVNLLLGLLHQTEGTISVDGVPLSSLELSQWQERIGYVPQDVFLLDDTLRANIAFGVNPAHVDQHRLRRAVAQAHLTEVVDGLPQGLDAPIGERGRRLSGGQVQRVAIARALYRSPDLVLLDEATSALDSMTEADIQGSFDELGDDVLAVAVAHRVSTLRNCHSIIVLDGGRVQDMDTYDALMERNQLFRDLAAQSRRDEAPGDELGEPTPLGGDRAARLRVGELP